MENSRSSRIRNMMHVGKNSLLPPKCPFPSISPSYAEYIPNSAPARKGIPAPRNGNSQHQRASSESFLIEEQPSWLDELLNEPETPAHRGGHRRSSSDSFAYIDTSNVGNVNGIDQDDNKFKNLTSVPSWGSQDFDLYRDIRHGSFYTDPKSSAKTKNRTWDAPVNPVASSHGRPAPKDTTIVQTGVSLSTSPEVDKNSYSSTGKQDPLESDPYNPKDSSHAKSSSSETDTKRAKQQFAQRSRVRKLQYIAELERNMQALQADGSEVSAELEFLNQQNLILSMENKTLKQRLESLAQEQLIKYFEHEVLEREVGRLRALYQQQQQQQFSSSHRRAKSRDLDQQFANLSLEPKEASSNNDTPSGYI
ncbi:uncharacterized protein At4g06598-like [Olea europaea var. sylvestris]|uniref:Transcription factor RF2a n=1 Tax=Olea europaea subsp. europaea TaxID=158383 RepID=A0A8S0UTE4_OLEEU|nr:uncharacterized protein At4g06598-like [Olea europaea var. sylvestris]XP_022898159.1 uncharacterized protein At4g06598-like [Olea europaea var. sylvestris]XP_022898160.1 uncharacterized protein At4g06598-like [Olea europaea var. sylvestris]CAA3021151.1 Transcription factor RF2a [Olea europaea subsp. europaea]